jgi:hypothetical protein
MGLSGGRDCVGLSRARLADRERDVQPLGATRCHNWHWNAKRPTTLGVSLRYNPTVSEFRNGGFKLRERNQNLRLRGLYTISAIATNSQVVPLAPDVNPTVESSIPPEN